MCVRDWRAIRSILPELFMKIRFASIGQAASALLVCVLAAVSAHGETASFARGASHAGLDGRSSKSLSTRPDLTDLAVRVKVFKVFGDDDTGGDGSSKAANRARSRSRSAQKRPRNTRKAVPVPQTVDQPAGILLLLDPSLCDQIKM